MDQLSGQITVTTAGTAVAGPSSPNGSLFALKAHPANAGTVWVGNDGEDDVTNANGFPLAAGEGIVVEVGEIHSSAHPTPNLSMYVFDADTNGDIICWIRLQP